jgi:hypothetical protein
MTGRQTWKIGLAAGLASAAILLSAAELGALVGHTGPLMWSPILGSAESHDDISFRILEHASTPAAITAATAEVDRALELSPYDNQARLRLVYIDALHHPPVGPAGVAMLEQSYSLMPYDYTVAAWRLRFGLEHWAALSPAARDEVYQEAMAFARSNSQQVSVVPILQSIHDPQGRLAAALWLRLLNH